MYVEHLPELAGALLGAAVIVSWLLVEAVTRAWRWWRR
jgi:hypothetical protein